MWITDLRVWKGCAMRAPRSFLPSIVAAVLLAAPVADAAAPLVGQWHLDGRTQTATNDVTPDSSGNGLDLTTALNAMQFDTTAGRFSGYLSSANATTLKVTSPLLAPAHVTLLAWVKQNGDPGVLKYIAGRGDDGPGTCLGSSYALYTGYNAK